MGSSSLLQGIFPTQGSNPGLLHCRKILYQLSYLLERSAELGMETGERKTYTVPPPTPQPLLSEFFQRQLEQAALPIRQQASDSTHVICWKMYTKAGLPRSQFLSKSPVRTSFRGGWWGGIWKFPCEMGLTSLAFPRLASSPLRVERERTYQLKWKSRSLFAV